MTIKQQGGIFGRNPTFNDVDVEGSLTVGGSALPSADNLAVLDTAQTFTEKQTLSKAGVTFDIFNFEYPSAGDRISMGLNGYNSIFKMFSSNGGQSVQLSGGGGNKNFFKGVDVEIHNANLVMATAGKGIDFSATSGTGTSELFDDYEEGVWSPDLRNGAGGSVFASQANDGVYVKCGSMVWASAALFGASTSASTNVVTINLPFAASSTKTNSAAPMVYSVGFGAAVAVYVQDGQAYLKFTKTIGSIGSNVLCNEVTTGLRGYFSIVYSTV